MLTLLYRLVKPFLFLFDPERIHDLTTTLLGFWPVSVAPPRVPGFKLAGLSLPNPLGLAPGFVKDARRLQAATKLGFGFIEIGTLTRLPQAGNPKPRLFRLPQDRALINRFGFNNPGYHTTVAALRRGRKIIVGANLGKGKRTPIAMLSEELSEGVNLLTPYVDFFVVNLSSPNTPGLRALLEPQLLDGVLRRLAHERRKAAAFWQVPLRPLLLKLHPDLEPKAWRQMLDWLPQASIDGVIATNTTTSRSGLTTAATEVAACGAGGLSGAPLAPARMRMLRELRSVLPQATLIAVGGISSAEDVRASLDAGANAVEVYTGLIYSGPATVPAYLRGLASN